MTNYLFIRDNRKNWDKMEKDRLLAAIWTFNYRESAAQRGHRGRVEKKNLGNANARGTENETRPSFPAFKHSRIYYLHNHEAWPSRFPWPATYPISFSKSLLIEERIGSSLRSVCLLAHGYRWMRCGTLGRIGIRVSDRKTIRWRSASLFARTISIVSRPIFLFFFFLNC